MFTNPAGVHLYQPDPGLRFGLKILLFGKREKKKKSLFIPSSCEGGREG